MSVKNDARQRVVDAYAQSVQDQKEHATEYEKNVREVLVPKDEQASETANASYANMKYATGVFSVANSDQATLERQKEQIIQERDLKIAQAREQALRDNKSAEEIEIIVGNIMVEYADVLLSIDYNITKATKIALNKQNSLMDAKSIYQRDHFNQIVTSNDVYSGFMYSSMLWHDVGKMQQHQAFLQTLADNGEGRHLDYNI